MTMRKYIQIHTFKDCISGFFSLLGNILLLNLLFKKGKTQGRALCMDCKYRLFLMVYLSKITCYIFVSIKNQSLPYWICVLCMFDYGLFDIPVFFSEARRT